MEDLKITGQRYNFVCFRYGCIIRTGEKMVSLSVSVETSTEDGGVQIRDATTISTLYSGCASVLLGQAIARDPDLMMPLPKKERLGHASIQITLDTYSHVAPGLQAAAAESFDKLVSPKYNGVWEKSGY